MNRAAPSTDEQGRAEVLAVLATHGARTFDEILARLLPSHAEVVLAAELAHLLDAGFLESFPYRGRRTYRLAAEIAPPIPPPLAGIDGTPFARYRRAEYLYLVETGWQLREGGRWTHPHRRRNRPGVFMEHALMMQLDFDERALVAATLKLKPPPTIGRVA